MTIKLVRDLMHIGVVTCRADILLIEAVRTLLREELEAFIVLDDNGHAVGMLSRREVVAAYGRSGSDTRDIESLTVADVMRPDIPEVPPDIPATAAAQMMLDWGVREIYLMHHGGGISWPAAVLRFDDVLRYVAAESDANQVEPATARPGESMGAGAPRRSPIEAFMERYSKADRDQSKSSSLQS